MNNYAIRGVQSLLKTTLPSAGGGGGGGEPHACKTAALAMAIFKLLVSGLCYFRISTFVATTTLADHSGRINLETAP